jgi:large subunit ribosomal protein L25
MATVDLQAEFRTVVGKEGAKKLRQVKRIPAIVYGGPRGPIPVVVNPLELLAVLEAGENVLINLSLTGGEAPQTSVVILKELQRHPVKGSPLHADFQEISMERKIRVEVPLWSTRCASSPWNVCRSASPTRSCSMSPRWTSEIRFMCET